MTDQTPAPDAFRAHWVGGTDLAVRALADEDERGRQFDRMLREQVARELDDFGDLLSATALNTATLVMPENSARRDADRELLEFVRARAAALRDGATAAQDDDADDECGLWCS